MSAKIVICGRYFVHDTDRLEGESLRFALLPKPDMFGEHDRERLLDECADADLLIIAMFGSSAGNVPLRELKAISCPKAYWSFDSHHQWHLERLFQHLFEGVFVAHLPYLKFFDDARSHWLPCCYSRFETKELLELLHKDTMAARELDLAFPHKPYPAFSRDRKAALAASRMRDKRIFMDSAKSGIPYMHVLQKAGVVLNFPIMDDLNIRNFEAWALNRVLLTQYVPGMDRLGPLTETSVFFTPDLGDFHQKMELALSLAEQPRNTAALILNGHMLAHRYATIINTMLGTKLDVRAVDAGEPLAPKTPEAPPAAPVSAHGINVGVAPLARRHISPAPQLCANRLQIEDNIGESIHIHWRNLRLDYTIKEFLSLAKTLEGTLGEFGLRLNPVGKNLTLHPGFARDLGPLKEAITGYSIEWKYLDDLSVLVATPRGFVAALLCDSPVQKLLDGDGNAYLDYNKAFPRAGRSFDRV